MATFQVFSHRPCKAGAYACLAAFVLIVAVAANADDGSCSTSEPAAGSALMQIHAGHPNHPKRTKVSDKAAGKSDAWGFFGFTRAKQEKPKKPKRSEPSDRADSKKDGDISDQVQKEDPSNQAEADAGVPPEFKGQREQGNDKTEHAEDFSDHPEEEDPSNRADDTEVAPAATAEREQGTGKKDHAKHPSHQLEEADPNKTEAAEGVPEIREQREIGKQGKGKSQKKSADVSELASKLGSDGACKSHPCRLTRLAERERNLGKHATLDEAGYQKVAALRDDAEMAEYVARVIRRCDFKLGDMRGMMSIVPWFSGTTAVQSFEALEDALLGAALVSADEPWLTYKNSAGVSGDSADLSVVGYMRVAALKDGVEMNRFARRLCKQIGVKVVDEFGFDGAVQSYIESDGFKSYERLQAELRSAANANRTSWAKWGKRPAALASTQHALRADATAFDRAAMRVSTRGFCTLHPCSSLMAAQGKPSGRGKQAPLDEAGYQQVARLKDDKEMRDFILRVVAMYDCKVTRDGGLSGIVPWFSGTTEVQSFEKLEEVLLFAIIADPKNAWISYRNTARVSGDNAALNLTGYIQVAAIRSTNEMKKFARRLCKDLGVKIVNEGGFEGMVNFYSGSQNFQSFERLVSEIKSAARAPNSWAKKM